MLQGWLSFFIWLEDNPESYQSITWTIRKSQTSQEQIISDAFGILSAVIPCYNSLNLPRVDLHDKKINATSATNKIRVRNFRFSCWHYVVKNVFILYIYMFFPNSTFLSSPFFFFLFFVFLFLFNMNEKKKTDESNNWKWKFIGGISSRDKNSLLLR